MLYDPKWEKDKQLGPISLRALIAWLETKPPKEKYEYCFPQSCALAQFRAACGFAGRDLIIDLGMVGSEYEHSWQSDLDDIVNQIDCTFGGALKRARKVLARRT